MCSDEPLSPDRDTAVFWRDIYPRILSFACDVLTILDCCHSGAAALTPSHIAAVNAVHGVDRTFSKEVIATAGFQAIIAWAGAEYSLPPLMDEVLARYRVTGNLDSATLFNEISFRMKELYRPPSSLPIVPSLYRRNQSWEEPRATNPVRYVLVQGNSGSIVLKPLPDNLRSALRSDTLACRVAAGFMLPPQQFIQYVRETEAGWIDREYERIERLRGRLAYLG